MLPEGVLSIAITAHFWQPKKTKEKQNWATIDISMLSSIGYRYQKSCMQPCHGHITVMPKGPKMCRFSSNSSTSHFLFPRDCSETIADTDITTDITVRHCVWVLFHQSRVCRRYTTVYQCTSGLVPESNWTLRRLPWTRSRLDGH